MDLMHHGNWLVVGRLVSENLVARNVYECPLCSALVRDPMSHGEYHQWTGTDHPYSIEQRTVSR